MPHYLFHITRRAPQIDETIGVHLPDLNAAWHQATETCGQMLKEFDELTPVAEHWRMDVSDGDGPLFSIHFGARRQR